MESMTDARMERLGMTFIHPFADPHIIARQGTIGLEILEELPDLKSLVILVGGGLIKGIAFGIKAKKPQVRIYGVQAEGAAPLPLSLKTDIPEKTGPPRTIADGIAATMVFDYMLPLFNRNLSGAFVVSDEEIRQPMRRILRDCHAVPEPAGAAVLAAALKHLNELERPIACVISGG
jgi:threonine dehydratase